MDRDNPNELVDVANQPYVGSSIGVAGLRWSVGTLGGFFELKKPGKTPIPCAITCHHVVRPTRRDIGLKPVDVPIDIPPDPLPPNSPYQGREFN